MADLLVDEQRVEAVLDQMGHVRGPQAVRMQHRVQGELVAPVGEPVVDVSQANAALAFGGPQHRRVGQPEAREHFLDVLEDRIPARPHVVLHAR